MSLDKWAHKHEFGSEEKYDSTVLTSMPPGLCGLYLLTFQNGDAYVGISTNIRTRLRQHERTYDDIATFRVRALHDAPYGLRRIERDLVHSAQRAKLTVRNKEHAAVIAGDAALDDVVSPDEQRAWFADPASANRADPAVGVTYGDSQLASHAASFEHLQAHPRFADIVGALGTYLDLCVPFPLRTEGTFWTVSCYPSGSRTMICRVSMCMLETFYIVADRAGHLGVCLFVDDRELPRGRWFVRKTPWRTVSRHARRGPVAHVSAGPFERRIVVDDISHLEETLMLPGVGSAAAAHALAVMRRGQSKYKVSHNPHLASAATAAMGLVAPVGARSSIRTA